MRPALLPILIPALALLAGCGSPRTGATIQPVPLVATTGTVHHLHIATTRERSADPSIVFDGERARGLGFATVDVSVPPSHKPGQLELPKGGKADPAKHLVAFNTDYVPDENDFVADLRSKLKVKPADERHVLVFIHGYNTLFDEGIYRVAQLVQDTGFDGTVVLFTWASRGRTIDYIYDRDSATAARDGLERTLSLISKAGASRVSILAHSMGNWVTVEALRQLKIAEDESLEGKLGDVILASPDIDVDVFKTQMRRYGTPNRPFFVLISRDDRALMVSSLIAGNRKRLGDYADDKEIAELGVTVVDLTAIKGSGDDLNHAKFAHSPELVKLLGERLRLGDNFTVEPDPLTESIGTFGRSLGGLVGATADIVITTPRTILSIPLAIAGQR